MKLAGKVVIVTGAASGVGEATATLFTDDGASVIVADLDEVRCEQVAGVIRRGGAQALFARTDVSDPDDVQATVRLAMGRRRPGTRITPGLVSKTRRVVVHHATIVIKVLSASPR